MLSRDQPALILAPMDGFTDAPMRALQGEIGNFSFAVSEFLRVSASPLPVKVFHREIPELLTGGKTLTGLQVQVQILGGNPDLMATTAMNACEAGAKAIDLNFGCPAPIVNRHDGGASILRQPTRIRDIVTAVRASVPAEIPVSSKIRLGWDSIDEVHQAATMAALGGSDWLVVHARTKEQRYRPPVFWSKVGEVRNELDIPVVANGDIWTLDDFRRCRDETGCQHFMLGRGALTDPRLSKQIALEMGLSTQVPAQGVDWFRLLKQLYAHSLNQEEKRQKHILHRLKQWLNLASRHGGFEHFAVMKRCQSSEDFFTTLTEILSKEQTPPVRVAAHSISKS